MKKSRLAVAIGCLLLSSCGNNVPAENPAETAKNQAIADFNAYAESIKLDDYRDEEKEIINKLVAKIKAELEREDITANEVNALLNTLKAKVSELKTDAYYDELELNELNAIKEEIKASLPKITNRYRDEEKAMLKAAESELLKEIDALNSKESATKFSIAKYEELLRTTKEDANYLMKELENNDVLSKWPLVTEHRNTWTYSETEVKTNSIAYALDKATYSKNMSFEMSVTSDTNIGLAGVLIANQSTVGDGLDGYVVNIVSNNRDEFVQVFQLTNAYCNGGPFVCDYIGGWVYPGKTNGTTFRIEIEDNYLKMFDKGSDVNGGEVVDLTRGGKITLSDTYHLGFLNWDAGIYTQTIGNIVAEKSINGVNKAKGFYNDFLSAYDINDYSDENAKIIEDTTKEINNSTDYNQIIEKLEAAKITFPQLKTLSYDNAVEIMDHIFSTDNSTQSAWDLVVEHAMGWTHGKGTNTVTTSGLAGWQLTKESFVNFEMILEIDVATPINPFTGVLSKAILFGADLANDPNKVKGFAISVYKNNGDNWVQITYNDGSEDCKTQFLGAVVGDYEKVKIKLQVKDKVIKLYNANNGLELCGGDFWSPEGQGFAVPGYEGGKIGIYDWTDIKSTFTIHSFKAL